MKQGRNRLAADSSWSNVYNFLLNILVAAGWLMKWCLKLLQRLLGKRR